MEELRRERSDLELLSPEEEQVLFDDAQRSALEESGGNIWAAGNVRIGDYILGMDWESKPKPKSILIEEEVGDDW